MVVEMVDYLPRGSAVRDRLEAYSMPVTETGCWLWLAALGRGGYGLTKIHGKTRPAHRASYEEYVGPIPEGLCVLHRCDTPGCINPEHLFLGTHKDNNLDRDRKGRTVYFRGSQLPQAKLTEEDVREIIVLLQTTNLLQREIGRRYGVLQQIISAIHLGVKWCHVTQTKDQSDE